MTEGELFVVFSNAFSFLSSMSKSHSRIRIIYERVGKGKDVSYGNYMGWINTALANKFRK